MSSTLIDGSVLEGGGQLVRNAVALAALLQRPVTVERIRAHQAGAAGDDDAGWSEIVLDPPRRLDLLELTNGVLASLGATPVPAGRYTQLRLVLAPNRPGSPLANSVVPTATGTEVALTTPSATRSGLKLAADIEVPVGRTADVVLDFVGTNQCACRLGSGI